MTRASEPFAAAINGAMYPAAPPVAATYGVPGSR